MENKEEAKGLEMANEMYSFKELISIIVDYYCFKNNIVDEEGDGEAEAWKVGTKYEHQIPESIIPEDIDSLIQKSFASQLKKFI